MALEVDGWSDTLPDTITSIGGVDTDEGSLANLVNNVARRLASAMSAFRKQAYCKDLHVTIQASGGAAPASPQDKDLWIEYTP